MLINGRSTTQIDALDRGLCYGDGLFETVAVIEGQPQLWQQHIERLSNGCRRLGMTMPAETLLRQDIQSLYRERSRDQRLPQRLVAKIIVTRGTGGRGYRITAAADCSRVISLFDWPDYPPAHGEGISVRWCNTRLGLNPALAGIKHLNRLEQVMARNEWQDDRIAEGLMLDSQGHVIEGTMTNLFIVANNQLQTARLDHCGVAGIVRQLICADSIQHGLSVCEQGLTKDDVLAADEVFVCNSLIGIWPVTRIDDPQTPQDFAVGPVSRRISILLQQFSTHEAALSSRR